MVMEMKRPFRSFRSWKKKRKEMILEQHYEKQLEAAVKDTVLTTDVDENLNSIITILGDSADLVTRSLIMQTKPHKKAVIIFIDELINKDIVHEYIIRPLLNPPEDPEGTFDLWEFAEKAVIQAGETKVVHNMDQVIDGILCGDTVLLIHGFEKALVIGTKGWATRSIDEPRAESVVRGPREGLNETLTTSLALIRRRLKDPNLRVKFFTLGKRSKTVVSVLYIEGICAPHIVKEITDRIKKIEMDAILETGYIEEMLQEDAWSPFPVMQNTERPDSVVAHLLEGKVGILVDGTPHCLIAPAIFNQFYNSPEDYYERYMIATFLRGIRLISLFIALLLPSIYIAFVSFNPEMIPSRLAFAMAAGRSTVPFSPIFEALIMEIAVEILREASIRLPSPIGPTIGIVGALVIGNAAVSAGLVSPAFVIIVGLTTMSSYANPYYNAAISVRLLRFPFMILASIFGLYGIMLGILILMIHLIRLRSFGIPYMSPFAPLNWQGIKDSLIRVPWPYMKKRPQIFQVQDRVRVKGEVGDDAG